MTKEEAITVMQLYKDELEHRIAIAKTDYDPGAIDLYSIQLDAFDVAIEELSAEVEPTVIRSRTLMQTKDFKEWAKRIREENPNAIVIPCDAEVVSAEAVTNGRLIDADALSEKLCETTIFIKDGELFQRMINDAPTVSTEAVQGWIPVSERLPSESGDYICTIPLDAEETYTEVLTFHKGRFYEDDDEWGAIYHDDVLAWMPLPMPYREDGEYDGED